jgi:hypothetical protein
MRLLIGRTKTLQPAVDARFREDLSTPHGVARFRQLDVDEDLSQLGYLWGTLC